MAKKSRQSGPDFFVYQPVFDAGRFFRQLLLLAAFTLVFVAVVSRTWITEDAFISFRVIDNFLNGYGLRWNIDERVQAFTHPLWLFVQMPFYLAFGDPFPTIITSSLACLVILLLMLIVRYRQFPWVLLFCFAIPFALSLPLIEFTTSGLENPLTFLLLGIFFFLLTQAKPDVLLLSFCGALIGLNRLDCMVFVLPTLFLLWLRSPDNETFGRIVKGLTPLFLWHVYSFFYYGFALPNTYYAKLHTGVPSERYLKQGFIYLQGILHHDVMSALILLIPLPLLYRLLPGIFGQAPSIRRAHIARDGIAFVQACVRHKDAVLVVWLLSIICSVLYVISVGGDFMSGRFFTPAMVAGLLALVHHVASLPAKKRKEWSRPFIFALFLLAFTRGLTIGYWDRYDWKSGIISEWIYYHKFCWLWNEGGQRPSDFDWSRWARMEGAMASRLPSNEYRVLQFNNVGMYGYYNHPQSVVIDAYALTEPLLARLPVRSPEDWRIGHFMRDVPKGYLHARATGDTKEMNPDLAAYYKALRIITSGHLLSKERLKTLYLWHWGYFDHHRQAYLDTPPEKR